MLVTVWRRSCPEDLAAAQYLTQSHQVAFGRKSFEELYGTKQEESAVLPKVNEAQSFQSFSQNQFVEVKPRTAVH